MRTVVSILLVSASFVCGDTWAFDFITGRGDGTGQTLLLSRPSASTILAVPSTCLSTGTWVVELGANRKFEIKDLDQGYIAFAGDVSAFTCSFGFTQFGYGDLYAERTARLSAAWHRRAFSVGVALSTMQVDFGGHYDNLGACAVDLSAAYHCSGILTALVAENLNEPRLANHSESILPRYSLYTEFVGPGPYSVTGRVTARRREKPRFGVGQFIDISTRGSLFWGFSTAPLIYGGGLELSYKRSIITYATSYHPTLGFSHTLSVSFAFGGKGRE